MAELTQQLQQAQQQLQQSDAKRSSLNTENIGLRAQLKRTQRTSDAAESSASGAAAELASYQADIQERVSTDSESRLRSAGSTAELLEFELRRGELTDLELRHARGAAVRCEPSRVHGAHAARLHWLRQARRGCQGLAGAQYVLCTCCAVHVLCMCCACAAMRRRTALDSHERSTGWTPQ